MALEHGEFGFIDIVRDEARVINRRRKLVARHRLAKGRGRERPGEVAVSKGSSQDRAPIKVTNPGIRDERGQPVPRITSQREVVGLACSGGGVRSAAFCLGVFQGLDSLTAEGQPQVFDAVDYLSTVSGGGYIGTSLVAGLAQTQGRFPFESKLDEQETPETQHLRDYSKYLAPDGLVDILVGVVAIMRGLLINAMIFLGIILAAAAFTVAIHPKEDTLRRPLLDLTGGAFHGVFLWTTIFVVLFLVVQIGYTILWLGPLEHQRARTTLRQREGFGHIFVFILVFCALVSFLELQSYILAGLFDARHLRVVPKQAQQANQLGGVLHWLSGKFPTFWSFLLAAATALATFGNKLIAVATTTRGDASWTGFLKHWTSRVAVYLAAIVVPLLLWFSYLTLCFWGIGWETRPGELTDVAPQTPTWLASLAIRMGVSGSIWEVYTYVALVLLGLSIFVTPNANSLHGYYRDRLSRAFLWRREQLEQPAKPARRARAAVSDMGSKAPQQAPSPASEPETVVDIDQFKLSSLKPRNPSGEWSDSVRFAPYLLINTAVNLEGSKYLNRRGRNADSFIFSPLYVGSQATGYSKTSVLEGVDPNVNLGTAMAISGAAASANMGASTIGALTFSLAALNVRLGYWLPNPRFLANWNTTMRRLASIGPWYFAKETFGLLDEDTRNVYLTDGGHFDNLGLYELLKRRCTVIVVADAEADPSLNFESLVRLQTYARIDLGVLIDLPWEDIRRSSEKITNDNPHGPSDDPARCYGPHVAVGRIDYGEEEHGVLVYIKASMSGDESDLIRDYRRRNADFPDQTTLDQFFSEEQFEVYRALGFHATRNFFIGRDQAAMLKTGPAKDWPSRIQEALNGFNIPADAVARIAERQRDAMVP
ncbi:MAG: hypothetical protein ACHQAY_25185 [Hyphomicrobiales bacterium]